MPGHAAGLLGTMRILWVATKAPWPPADGGRIIGDSNLPPVVTEHTVKLVLVIFAVVVLAATGANRLIARARAQKLAAAQAAPRDSGGIASS